MQPSVAVVLYALLARKRDLGNKIGSIVFQRESFKMYEINILISGLQLYFVVSFKLEKH